MRQFWHLQDWMNSSVSWLPDILLWWQYGNTELSKYTKIFNLRWIGLRMRLNTIASVWGYSRILYSHRYYCLSKSPPLPCHAYWLCCCHYIQFEDLSLLQFCSSWRSKYWEQKIYFYKQNCMLLSSAVLRSPGRDCVLIAGLWAEQDNVYILYLLQML